MLDCVNVTNDPAGPPILTTFDTEPDVELVFIPSETIPDMVVDEDELRP